MGRNRVTGFLKSQPIKDPLLTKTDSAEPF